MPSFSKISVAAIMALSGLVSAIPQYATSSSPYSMSNGTTTENGSASPSGTSNSTSTADDSSFCPILNEQIYTDGRGISYIIECGKTHFGIQISISIGTTKRATYESLGDCIALCDATSGCVGTAFDTNAHTCTLYSEVGNVVDAPGTDFALLTNPNGGAVVSSGGVATSTQFSTSVVTVESCAPTVTNCPLRNNAGGVVTQVVAVASTTYICPAQTTLPATPIACTSCPYSAVTATQYTATSNAAGVSTIVPVKTVVVNYPLPTGTQITVTVCTSCATATAAVNNNNAVGSNNNGAAGNGAGAASASGAGVGNGASATASMAMYTGAAGQLKAGMGFAAFVAGAAVLI